MENEQGFRCNCQGCDATKEHPCSEADELTTLRARVSELEQAMPSPLRLREAAIELQGEGHQYYEMEWLYLKSAASRIESVMKKPKEN